MDNELTQERYLTDRLEDQIAWHERKAQQTQRWHRRLTIAEICSALAIPLLIGLYGTYRYAQITAAALAGAIALITALRNMYQLQERSLWFRSTAEALKHEKYLFLARAGPYGESSLPLLAEKVESLVSQEHAKWAAVDTHGSGGGSKD